MRIRMQPTGNQAPADDHLGGGDHHQPELKVRSFRIGFVGTLGVLLALALGAVIQQLGTVIIYVAVALFLAMGIDPFVGWLHRRGLKRGVAILIVIVAVILIVGGLIAAIVPVIVTQATFLITNWTQVVDSVRTSDFVLWLDSLVANTGFDLEQAIKQAGDWLKDPATLVSLGGGIFQVGANVASGFTAVIIVLILTLYFAASLHSLTAVAARFAPASSRGRFLSLANEITGAVGRYVLGQLLLGAVNGVLSLIVLSIIGAPVPILLAFVAFLCSLLPLVGTLSGTIIISLACLAASPLTALIAFIYYLIYMQVEAYVLSPRIMSKAVAVPGALVVIAAIAGGTLGGVLGALVSIPVAASLVIIVQKVWFPRQDAA